MFLGPLKLPSLGIDLTDCFLQEEIFDETDHHVEDS